MLTTLPPSKKSTTTRSRINNLDTALKLSKHYDPTKQTESILFLRRMHREIRRAQQQATPLTKPLLNQIISNCNNSLRGLKNKVPYRLGCETMRRRSRLCALKLKAICQAYSKKPAIRLNFSKTDQLGAVKILFISQEVFDLLEKWRSVISDEGYVLKSLNGHGHCAGNLRPARISALSKALQENSEMDCDEQPPSAYSFRMCAALEMLEQGEPLEKNA